MSMHASDLAVLSEAVPRSCSFLSYETVAPSGNRVLLTDYGYVSEPDDRIRDHEVVDSGNYSFPRPTHAAQGYLWGEYGKQEFVEDQG